MAKLNEVGNAWYVKACAKMVREGKAFFAVTNEMDLGLTKAQCNELEITTDFQQVLRGERYKYYKEISTDPNRSKNTNIGNLLYCADELMRKGQHKEAANVIMNVMKAEGQLEDKTTVNIFGDVTAKDLAAMRERISKQSASLTN
jgi:hypothetical protein